MANSKMIRRNLLKFLGLSSLAVIFFPVLSWAGEFISALAKKYPKKYITSCKDCKRNFDCCKIVKTTTPKEFEIMKKHLRHGREIDVTYRSPTDEYIMKNIPCPFLSKDNKCDIHDLRPHSCRTYFCSDFGFSKEEQRGINLKVLKEWNFGANVKL